MGNDDHMMNSIIVACSKQWIILFLQPTKAIEFIPVLKSLLLQCSIMSMCVAINGH